MSELAEDGGVHRPNFHQQTPKHAGGYSRTRLTFPQPTFRAGLQIFHAEMESWAHSPGVGPANPSSVCEWAMPVNMPVP